MSDIFNEVDEGLRQERIETIWKRWRLLVYAAGGLLVSAVAINEFLVRPQMEKQRAARALAFEQALSALEESRYEEATSAFTRLMEEDEAMAPLAAHFLAQTLYEGGGDVEGAADVLAASGTTEGGPYERLALLKTAYLRADTLSLEELEVTLGTLVNEDSTLGALGRELLAAKAFQAGDTARARTEFNRLRLDPAATPQLVQRAGIALAAIPIEPEEQINQPEQGAAAPAELQENGQ